jgi:hypothetical protein
LSYLLETQSVGRLNQRDTVVFLQLDPIWLRVIAQTGDGNEVEIIIPSSMFKALFLLIEPGKVQEWRKEWRSEHTV